MFSEANLWRTGNSIQDFTFESRMDVFRFLLLAELGMANPRNSRLHPSQRRLYLNKIFNRKGVGRYPRLILLLLQLGHRWEIIFKLQPYAGFSSLQIKILSTHCFSSLPISDSTCSAIDRFSVLHPALFSIVFLAFL